MKGNIPISTRVFSLLLMFSSACAVAQQGVPHHLSGLINDYSPSTVKGGPWEMHGQWTLDLHPEWNGAWVTTADFSTDMTMSDYQMTDGMVDATKGGQSPHTHHIKLTNRTLTWNMDGCPTVSPATTMGFQINGTVDLVTGNGSAAPFETSPITTTLQVCVTGGNQVPYSNVTLVFVGPATTHFGTQAIHGVVRTVGAEDATGTGR